MNYDFIFLCVYKECIQVNTKYKIKRKKYKFGRPYHEIKNRCCVIFIILYRQSVVEEKITLAPNFRDVVVPRVEILLAKGLFRVHSRRHHYIILFSPNTPRVRSCSCTSEHDTKPLQDLTDSDTPVHNLLWLHNSVCLHTCALCAWCQQKKKVLIKNKTCFLPMKDTLRVFTYTSSSLQYYVATRFIS